jgi:adenosylcobinamide kinase/adenosylcobinamide-phosphate guanylyltransferase
MTVENKIETILYLGGCRSGKSRLAEEYCRSLYKFRTYVATMTITGDKEMNHRIKLHKSQRGDQWQLIEEPYKLGAVLQSVAPGGVVLVDCLTMWLTNLLLAERTDAEIEKEVVELCTILKRPPCSIVLVANEVGLGIVPESALARRFRDLAGWTNQQVAAVAHQVYFVAGGLPMVLKGGDA